jgi:hypothetical protein
MDLCLAKQIIARLGDAVATADEVHGFKYFDERDLLGFVDGTENPEGQAAIDATIIGEEDVAFARGQLCDRTEVPSRPDEVERTAGRDAGEDHRPHEAVRYRAGRYGQAELRAQCPDYNR